MKGDDEVNEIIVKLFQKLQLMKKKSPEYEEMIKKIRAIVDSIKKESE